MISLQNALVQAYEKYKVQQGEDTRIVTEMEDGQGTDVGIAPCACVWTRDRPSVS